MSNKGYGIATASSRTALFCNIKMYGQYIFVDGDTQSDYYFIGAGSVVTKDIPPYQIWAGNPARFIKERVH